MRLKLFTHNDLDGIGCEIFAKQFYGAENVSVEVCGYNDINERFEKYIDTKDYENYEETYMTDISISEELAKKVEALDIIDFRILDHHKTAYHLNKYEFATVMEKMFNKKTSGAWMFYKYQHMSRCDENCVFYDMIRMYDTWEWKETGNQEPKLLNDLFKFFGREKFVALSLQHMAEGKPNFLHLYSDILDVLSVNIKAYCEEKHGKMVIHKYIKYRIGFVCAEQNISVLGNYLCENSDIDFVMININNETISMRTIKDIDLSEIAKANGGGGHPKASGFRMENDWLEGLKITFPIG